MSRRGGRGGGLLKSLKNKIDLDSKRLEKDGAALMR